MAQHERRQRIGIFGGTFDPIHVGHLLLAEHCLEQLELDQVRFMPAAISPLKQDREAADAKHRLEMVQLAISGQPCFAADDRELRRGGTSYTVDTLAEIALEMPEVDLVFMMGADSLADWDAWRAPQRICQLAFVAVLARGGQPPPNLSLLEKYLPEDQKGTAAQHLVHMPQIELSSSDIRSRIISGRSTRYMLHPTTVAYIAAQGLYSRKPNGD